MSKADDDAAAFYEDPEHLRPAGPWVARRVRPGIKSIVYDNPAHDPRSHQTLNAATQPHWEYNPEAQ